MRKVAAIAAVLSISLGGLTACSSSSAYCDELKKNEDAAKADASDMKSTIDKMKKVKDKAPSEVKGDWQVLIDYLEKSEAAKGDPSKAKDLTAQAGKITTASQNITKHAKDKCNIELKS
jgi:hypothetical protein